MRKLGKGPVPCRLSNRSTEADEPVESGQKTGLDSETIYRFAEP